MCDVALTILVYWGDACVEADAKNKTQIVRLSMPRLAHAGLRRSRQAPTGPGTPLQALTGADSHLPDKLLEVQSI